MSPLASHSPELTTTSADGWTLHVADEIDSTNNAARHLPAWHALRARLQTAGRGRTGRAWVSDDGGLWISAVLPCPGDRAPWSILPLAAGWAIIQALQEFGARDLRLRWPNDIMVGARKLAGILVERYHSDTAVIGLGLNVFNQPATADATLAGQTVQLADLAPGAYTLDDVASLVLRSIRTAHALVRDGRFSSIADSLNAAWSHPRPVEITLTQRAEPFTGTFHGIDAAGRLRLTSERHGSDCYDAAQVSLLRELA
ncbi:biotin--[acetyl-CoA-carboxylase] ligase [Opitutus terrae]|uniref:Biotin--acetyl-CoA-carboxylase ligase n=1 Tax=Opitutus terrae (strain DSM 11246 / JCM 15787 / PB90-1) TaxID=452637 RepID=B1ZTE0_OPITP|nr:biotin--[acetyl-CoA-carboxylase] ligase [Opitutus terrae]ACB76594.1 biotin--acetyl-CoA-carboxylase ligase [Opitutus terrae PB90-1]